MKYYVKYKSYYNKLIIKAIEAMTVRLRISKYSSYEGVSPRVALEWSLAIYKAIRKFTILKNHFIFVGEIHARNQKAYKLINLFYLNLLHEYFVFEEDELYENARYYTDDAIEVLSINNMGLAFSSSFEPIRGICINKVHANSYKNLSSKLKHNEKIRIHPISCYTIKSLVDHEIAHQLDSLLQLSTNIIIKEAYNSFMLKSNIDELSFCAKHNVSDNPISEFIAEAFAEYCNNKKCRAIAMHIGKIIMDEYRAYCIELKKSRVNCNDDVPLFIEQTV